MLVSLVQAGYAVVAYTQRNGTMFCLPIGSFRYLMQDLYLVIKETDYQWGAQGANLVDASRIGLVGHSLGSYVVTMASVSILNFLGEYQNNLRIVVEGAGPANLGKAASQMIRRPFPFNEWCIVNWAAFAEAAYLSPIGPHKLTVWQAVIGVDYCDYIIVPFGAVANNYDTMVPWITNHLWLCQDLEYNTFYLPYYGIIGGLQVYKAKYNIHSYLDYTFLGYGFSGHDVWCSFSACDMALGWIWAYMTP